MKQYGTWKVSLPGEEYTFEPDQILGSECLAIENEAGVSFEEWLIEIDKVKAIACQVLVWFLRQKAGIQEVRRDVDFKIRQLRLVRVPDPKGTDSANSATTTSKRSRTGSGSARRTGTT